MPEEYPIRDSILSTIQAQEPWPDNVKLYQPYEVEQILLPDNASCLSIQAFLKMCNLPFEVEMRWNAEFMSPSGRVPFIKCGAFVISELEPIVHFVANKGVSLCYKLSSEEKAEMRAYMSLITNVLVNAELYVSWVDEETYNSVTKVRNSSVYPWPLGWLQTRSKRNLVIKRLKALHWHDKSMEQVFADVEQCCNSLSQRLGEKEFFFGTQEEYLISQAFSIVQQRRLSPDRKASERKYRMSYTSSSPERYTDTRATALNPSPITENYIQSDVPDCDTIDIDRSKDAKNTDSMLTLSDILPEIDIKYDDAPKKIEESKSEDQFVETAATNDAIDTDINLSDAVIIEPPLSFYNKHGDCLDIIMEIELTEASNSDQDEIIQSSIMTDNSAGVEVDNVDIDAFNKKSKNDTFLEDEEFKENTFLMSRSYNSSKTTLAHKVASLKEIIGNVKPSETIEGSETISVKDDEKHFEEYPKKLDSDGGDCTPEQNCLWQQ